MTVELTSGNIRREDGGMKSGSEVAMDKTRTTRIGGRKFDVTDTNRTTCS